MTFSEERTRYLMKQFADDKASAAEINEMLKILQTGDESPELEALVGRLREGLRGGNHHYPVDWEGMWQQLRQSTSTSAPAPARVRSMAWRKIAVAASVILALGVGSYFAFFSKPVKQTEIVNIPVPIKDVAAPSISKATITLANGKVIYLDSIASGTISTEHNVTVLKTPDGKIIYSGNAAETVYNTLNNPRGSKVIDMQLSDGSRVWLNAGSSVTYPVAFSGKERKVSITGEAYFEIAPSISPEGGVKRSFIVSRGDVNVQVLGTHFNVNAYDDEEDIKVTLIEGSVKVSNKTSSGLLKPGQQAQIATKVNITSDVDIEAVMAWKNGLFEFKETDIQNIMRQIERWYDVEVVFEGPVTQHFNGTIQRQVNVSKVLGMLEKTGGVRFSIEGRRVTVKKY